MTDWAQSILSCVKVLPIPEVIHEVLIQANPGGVKLGLTWTPDEMSAEVSKLLGNTCIPNRRLLLEGHR